MTGVLRRQTRPARGHVTTETEPAVMMSQTKEHLLSLEVEKDKKDPVLEAGNGVWPR